MGKSESKVKDISDTKDGKEQPGGEPMEFDPTFKGPIKNRSCTDIICCLLFLVCFSGMLFVGVWAYTKGDPILLLYPTDSDGNLCGEGAFATKPYLFFFDLIDCARVGVAVAWMGCPTPQVCVASCPNKYWEWFSQYSIELADPTATSGRADMICKYTISNPQTSSESVLNLVENEDCAAYYLNSSALAGRCVPTFIAQIVDAAGDLINSNETIVDKLGNAVNGTVLEEGTKYLAYLLSLKEYGMRILQDVRATWWLILVFLGITMVWCFIWIVLMRWIAGIMVWITIIAFGIVFAGATFYCFSKYVELKNLPASNGAFVFTTNLSYYTNLSETWLALGIISAVFLLFILVLLIFLRNHLRIAIALIKEASKAVGNMVFTLFWPLVPWVLQLIVFTYWGASAIYLASMGSKNYASTSSNVTNTSNGDGTFTVNEAVDIITSYVPCDPNANNTGGSVCSFLLYGGDQYTQYVQIYQLFMLFWVTNFIVALGQMTLAGAFASYYWAFNKPADIPAFPLAASLWRCLRYHLGTIAFGSLIIAIIQMIRVLLEYLDRKLKGKESSIAKFFLKCLKCCFWLLEKFMKFINRNAYILTAVYGYNFCTAAFTAFNLILRNILRVAVVNNVTGFIVLIGKLVVTGCITVLAFYFFSGDLAKAVPVSTISDYLNAYTPSLNYYLVPVIIITLASFVIVSGFFSVYTMGVDTLFLCFLEDLERNNGSAEKPYFMSKGLLKILGKSNTPEVAKAKKE